MLAVQPEIILIDHPFTGDIEEYERQRGLGLILEHKLENKRLLHFFLLGRSQQIPPLEQRFFVQRAELAADLGIQRHAGRVKMPCRRMLQRMDQRGHVHRLPDLGSANDRDNVARHLARSHRQLIVAGWTEPSAGKHTIAVRKTGQHMIGIVVVLLRDIRRIQDSLHIVNRIEAEALAVFVQRIVFTQRIILVILAAVHGPKHHILRPEPGEAIGTDNIIKKRPRLRLILFLKPVKKRHLLSS
ncbi:hypothetical protein D3C75_751320 [compost metagenome]